MITDNELLNLEIALNKKEGWDRKKQQYVFTLLKELVSEVDILEERIEEAAVEVLEDY